MKKWVVLIAGVIIQMILGSVYAWSTFVPSLKSGYGLSNGQCGLIFGMIIAVFTISMIPAGRLLRKLPPKIIAIIGATLFMTGYICASFSNGNFPVLLVSLSIISGIGIGFGYVVPLTVGMKWFPDNKGLVTGVSVAGFGGGALLLSSLAEYLLNTAHWDVLEIFRFVGICFGIAAIISALFISEPPKKEEHAVCETKLKLRFFLKCDLFWHICFGMFAGTFAGLLTIGNLKPMALSFGLSSQYAAWIISVFALGNAIGRISWGQVHDHIGTSKTITMSLLFLGFALIPFIFKLPAILILLTAFISGIGFGACFVVYASSIVDYYGIDIFPKLYPICFLWYGLAGLIGPATGGWIVDTTGSYSSAVILSVCIVFLAFILLSFRLNKQADNQKVILEDDFLENA